MKTTTEEISLEEIQFRKVFSLKNFVSDIDPEIQTLFYYIRFSKFEELEQTLKPEQLNQLFSYPIGCIAHGGKYSWSPGYYFGDILLKRGHSYGPYTFEYFYIDRNNGEYPFGRTIKWSMLHLACALGLQDVVDYLLLKGANLNIKDETGRDCKDIVQILEKNIHFNNRELGQILKFSKNLKFENDIFFQFK